MTIEQLRIANRAGGVAGVTLKGQGGVFLVQITTRNGDAVLAKARGTEPRRFGNPASAINVLCDVGITIGSFDASEWHPEEKEETAGNRGRAEHMRKAHQAAAYTDWLAKETQAAIDDPRPRVAQAGVLERLDRKMATLGKPSVAARKKRA
ncbi:hypothetical protein XACN24_15755 (plasmid) [Xanthomonas albilineans]|nr:hypothetical protein [Xanthomonas albilineans]QHQ29956.1 conserved hypothetical protein (plasmid) [Xanthomonas albilineans]